MSLHKLNKYRLRNVNTENEFDEIMHSQDADGPFIITIKNMAGDSIVLSTGNGVDLKYDETDTVSRLYVMASRYFRVGFPKMLLLDRDTGQDLSISVFNYLGEDYEPARIGRFDCYHQNEKVKTPLPKRNLNLLLLMES